MRARLSERYHIVANIGDQFSDMGLHGDLQLMIPHELYFTP